MGSALVVLLVKYGLLVLLWVFVLAAVRVVRADLYGSRSPQPPPPPPSGGRAADGDRQGGRRRSSAHRLVVTEGPLAGSTISLGDRPITLGRGDDASLVLPDDYASSSHARLSPGDGAWLLEDLGSTNGTYLGADRVTRPTPVPLGQPIRIGRTTLELRR